MQVRHLTRVIVCFALAGALGCGGTQPAKDASSSPAPPKPEDVKPMPTTGHVVEWGAPGVPCQMKAGSVVPVAVIVKNAGDQVWRDWAHSDKGRGAIRLGARWWTPGETKVPLVDYGRVRGELTKGPVAPGGSATMTVAVTVPSAPGTYTLQLDLVEELVVWFENIGAAKLLVTVTVN